jgi:DNA gyrase subunit A
MANVLSLKEGETINSIIPVRDLEAYRNSEEQVYLLMATRRGMVKKTALSAYARPKMGGIIGIALDEGDSLIGVEMTRPGDEILLSTRNGMSIRFSESGARPMGRDTRGVKGIKLRGDDVVVGMVVADPEGFLLTVCEKGYGKRTRFGPNTPDGIEEAEGEEPPPEEPAAEESAAAEEGGEGEIKSQQSYRKQRRGGLGIRDIRTSERNGPVVAVKAVRENDDVMLVTTGGMVTRTRVREIRISGRNTQGVTVMNLLEGDKVASLARIPLEAEESAEAPEPAAAETQALPPAQQPPT